MNRPSKSFSASGITARFRLNETDRFFVVGSCIARDIERSLRFRGLNVLSTPFAVPPSESFVGRNIVNMLRIPAITQALSWSFGLSEFPLGSLIEGDHGLWYDLQVPGAVRPASRERTLERRADMQRYFARAAEADVVIFDLSGIDFWYDRAYDLALNANPPRFALRREPDRFECHIHTGADVRAQLLAMRDMFNRGGKPKRFIFSVSAGPINWVFRPGDFPSLAALCRATTRAAEGELADEYEDIAYAPLLEAAMSRTPAEVFDPVTDRVQVTDEMVGSMLAAFGIDREPLEPDYDEDSYLRANPDVRALIRAGAIPSGYHHWRTEGRAAGRPLTVSGFHSDFPIEEAEMRATLDATVPERVAAIERTVIPVTVTNTGGATYATAGRYPVYVCYRWYDANGEPAEVGSSVHTPLPETLAPGETAVVTAEVAAPKIPGTYTLALTLLQHCVAWFDDIDPTCTVRAPVVVEGTAVAAEPATLR